MPKITLSAPLFAGVAVASSSDTFRGQLHGVYVEQEGSCVRLTSTDGTILLTGKAERGSPPAPFEPFIVRISKQTDAILKACRLKNAFALELDTGTGMWAVQEESGHEMALGRYEVNGGQFPEYRRVIPKLNHRVASAQQTEESPSFFCAVLRRIQDCAKIVDSATLSIMPTGVNSAAIVLFKSEIAIGGVIMPVREKDSAPLSGDWMPA